MCVLLSNAECIAGVEAWRSARCPASDLYVSTACAGGRAGIDVNPPRLYVILAFDYRSSARPALAIAQGPLWSLELIEMILGGFSRLGRVGQRRWLTRGVGGGPSRRALSVVQDAIPGPISA